MSRSLMPLAGYSPTVTASHNYTMSTPVVTYNAGAAGQGRAPAKDAAYTMDTVERQQAVRKYRFTVEEYHRMGEAGIFHEDGRVELIDGEVMRMSPIGWRHIYCVRRLNRVLSEWTLRNSDGEVPVFVSVQDPFALNERGEPQPDLAILREPPIGRLPGPNEVLLLVEVADTSLVYDRETKLPRYAEAGLPEVWLVDLNADRFEVHSEPGPDGYRKTVRFARRARHPPGPHPRRGRSPATQRTRTATITGAIREGRSLMPRPKS